MKFGRTDLRDVLERASARETAARVAAGAIARALLRRFDIDIASHVTTIGGVTVPQPQGRRFRPDERCSRATIFDASIQTPRPRCDKPSTRRKTPATRSVAPSK